ncbi:hypothetical protein FE257_009597 [Aspergillus nanangensis]|uniref:Protein kinase domain-containing protein n=1 Tax=Aspergillus nanangensis TaxID=2582783 RepID=A0AAD4CJW8_ASPNN|nr:hypothetical protein FE257_009597 [Aspergillus nanangensis]
MAMKDSLLSLDLSPEDCLYRILRDDAGNKLVLCVHLKDLDLIPDESQTYGPEVIQHLSKLKNWHSRWNTLTVSKNETETRSEQDLFQPQALPKHHIFGDYGLSDILELQVQRDLNSRVFMVKQGERQCFLKIARFEFELNWLAQEIKAYHLLMEHNAKLPPKFLGYVYEETEHRVIGFLFEEILGRYPGIEDLGMCQSTLHQLHRLGIAHGDVNKHNMLITEEGVKLIDFEDSYVDTADKEKACEKMSEEIQGLARELVDNSGRGRPWTDEED